MGAPPAGGSTHPAARSPRHLVAGILGIVATAVLLLLWTANTRVEDLQRQHQALVEVAVEGTATEISLHLDELRRTLTLFAESHRATLVAVVDAPEDPQRLEDIARDVERVFPESFAYTLADSAGNLFVEDFDGLIDGLCRETIAAFATGSPGGGIAIHPHPSGYHFDLMTRVDLGPHGPGVFFISLGPELLTPLLDSHRLPSYELVLLHREIDGLIELVDTGSRDSLDREFYLDATEQDAIVYQTAVPGTLWSLAALPRGEGAIGSRVADIWQDNIWEILLLILIGGLALWQLKRSADREVAQNRMLTAVNRAESRFISEDEPAEVFSDALDDVLTLTRSEFGFLGEVVEQPGGEPYLRIYAIGHRGADHGVEAFLSREAPSGVELRAPSTLLSRVLADAECVIDNDLRICADDSVLPGGHPPLRSFLGAPLFHGVRMVGMIGLANRRRGYDTAMLQDLQPMLRSCGNLFGAMRNSQQRVLAEAALQASETRERAVLQTVVDGIVTTDDRGVIESVNPAAERMFGYAADELIGQDIGLLVPDADRRLYMRLLRRFLSSGASSTRTANRGMIGRRRDGSVFSVELAVSRMDLGGQVKLTGLIRDVTRRKNSERVLRENTALQRAILDGANHSIIATDREGTILVFNAGAQRMLGYSAAEMVGQRTPAIIHDPVEVADRACELSEELGRSVQPGFEVFAVKVLGGGSDEREWSYIRKDGSRFPVELSMTALRDDTGAVTGFLGIASDITERKRVERMKNEFIATVSHELRTPLTSIRGSLGLIEGGALGELPPQAESLLKIANKNSERLVRLINDILDIEKIESGRMRFDLRIRDLRPVIEQAIASSAGYAEEYGIGFDCQLPEQPCRAYADADRITQVMLNLLSNAAKFSPRGGRVEVGLEQHADHVRVSVCDHGAGIPEEFHERMFEKFAQADASDTREKGGTGLGLSICKAIIGKHRGQIGFESGPGQGTRFHFDLPARPPAEDDRPTGRSGGRQAQRVLICEDDPDVAHLLSLLLEDAGFETDVAASAGDARRRLRCGEYLAMTLDLDLPDQDGVSLLRELRENEHTRGLPVVVVSAGADQGRDRLDGGVSGVIAWISKPVERQRLLDALSTVVADADAMRRILHVEDDADVVQVVASILGPEFEVTQAHDLGEARRLLRTKCYHLVLLDVGLSDGSGLSLIPVVNELADPLPIVVFSGLELDEDALGGVDAALTKSRTTNTALIETVQRAIEREPDRLVAGADR